VAQAEEDKEEAEKDKIRAQKDKEKAEKDRETAEIEKACPPCVCVYIALWLSPPHHVYLFQVNNARAWKEWWLQEKQKIEAGYSYYSTHTQTQPHTHNYTFAHRHTHRLCRKEPSRSGRFGPWRSMRHFSGSGRPAM
jgi:hypothetical protein